MTTKMSGKCYGCKYQRSVPGDTHSRCAHPKVMAIQSDTNEFTLIASMLSGEMTPAAQELEIRANAHGVRSGWFMWPGNFDPVWLDNCNGFTEKEKAA